MLEHDKMGCPGGEDFLLLALDSCLEWGWVKDRASCRAFWRHGGGFSQKASSEMAGPTIGIFPVVVLQQRRDFPRAVL